MPVVVDEFGYAALALMAAGIGTLGGLGGAILLVPALVMTGMPASEAAPLGLITVAAGSISAGARQLEDRAVNHRLGVTTEVAASTGAVVGAVASGLVSESLLTWMLAVVAVVAAVASGRGRTQGDLIDPDCEPTDVGERVGAISGAYPTAGGIVPYQVRHLRTGLALMGVAGLTAGTAGVSGGFIKTPATARLMGVPMKVAASTTTFTVGITSSVALIVFAIQGRVDPGLSGSVIVGSLLGGQVGARLQSVLSPAVIGRLLSAALVVVAVILVSRA